MGNNFIDNRDRHKSEGVSQHNFRDVPFGLGLSGLKDTLAMAETKFLIFILNAIGYPLFGFTIIFIGGDVRGWILWALAAGFGIYKLIHAHLDAVKKNQENKSREMDLKEKEHNIYNKKTKHK